MTPRDEGALSSIGPSGIEMAKRYKMVTRLSSSPCGLRIISPMMLRSRVRAANIESFGPAVHSATKQSRSIHANFNNCPSAHPRAALPPPRSRPFRASPPADALLRPRTFSLNPPAPKIKQSPPLSRRHLFTQALVLHFFARPIRHEAHFFQRAHRAATGVARSR